MTATNLIQIHQLCRNDARTGRPILDHIDFSIQAGERIGLIGPSGSGKSTLLRAIAKLDPWDSGELLYRGRPVQRDDVPGFRRQVLYVSQTATLTAATGRDSLQRAFQFASARDQLDTQRVEGWLQRLGRSSSLLDQPSEQLSGGERQMIALIRALSLSPCILLLDEPTASLDADSMQRVESLVIDWQAETKREGDASRTLVWTSHHVEQIERVCTRVIRLNQGKPIEP